MIVKTPLSLQLCIFLFTAALTIFISGCSKVDSEDLRSSGFYAAMNLTAKGDHQTFIDVDLRTGPEWDADEIKLTQGDMLQASANGITKTLIRNNGYETSFDFDDSGTEFVISLHRENDPDMLDSSVTLPKQFDILTPAEQSTFSAGETITVTWFPVVLASNIRIDFYGECISQSGRTRHFSTSSLVTDTGNHVVAVNSILNAQHNQSQFDKNIPCTTRLEIARENNGSLDPNYGEGGYIKAKQVRYRSIQLNP